MNQRSADLNFQSPPVFKMKSSILFLIAISLFSLSCREQNPLVNLTPIDTSQGMQLKNVLIEDFTGVQCPNCPAAHSIAEQLHDQHGDRVEIVAIHSAGFLSFPFPYSAYDFRNVITNGGSFSAQVIDNFLGPASYYPMGTIDRKLFDGQNQVMLDRVLWAGMVNQRLTDTVKVELTLDKNYNAVTRKLDLTVSAKYLMNVEGNQAISVMITESGIIDPQEYPTHIDTNYVHNNVLRGMITNPTGDLIPEPTTANSTVMRTYSFSLPIGWQAENCRVIVFIALNDANNKELLQVKGIKVM